MLIPFLLTCSLQAPQPIVDDEVIARTVERTSFAFMKQNDHLFDPRRHRISKTPEPDLIAALAGALGKDDHHRPVGNDLLRGLHRQPIGLTPPDGDRSER